MPRSSFWAAMVPFVLALAVAAPTTRGVAQGSAKNPLVPGVTYQGVCDASAAVAVDGSRFLVADDEENVLRLYNRDHPEPLKTFDLADFLQPDPDSPESDLEAAARLGDRVYWITSHGRNKNAKERSSRHRFFATSVSVDGDAVQVTGVGKPYRSLLDDLLADSRLEKYRLADASRRAPKKKGGLNIEGLAAGPDGSLLIGFRNPQPEDHALVVPLLNPKAVADGREAAKFGPAIELDLDRRGIRDFVYHSAAKRYLIVAGSYESGGTFQLYDWTGRAADKPRPAKSVDFAALDLNPEVVFVYPGDARRIQFLSDDGTQMVGNVECKRVNPSQRSFRSALLVTGR